LQTLIASYTLFIVGFIIYFGLIYNRKKVEAYFQKKIGFSKANIVYVGLEKFVGFVVMLLLPLSVLHILGLYNAQNLGIHFTHADKVFSTWAFLGALIIVANTIRAGKPKNYQLYPQIRTQEWRLSLLGYYVFGWAIYLLGYEFLFRGILFFSGIDILPLWLNITINCVLYAIAHIHKGKLEIITSIPFGVVLCLVSYYTGSFWAAWLIHLTMALSNSLIAIKGNPNMKINFTKF